MEALYLNFISLKQSEFRRKSEKQMKTFLILTMLSANFSNLPIFFSLLFELEKLGKYINCRLLSSQCLFLNIFMTHSRLIQKFKQLIRTCVWNFSLLVNYNRLIPSIKIFRFFLIFCIFNQNIWSWKSQNLIIYLF